MSVSTPGPYVQIPFTTDPSELADNAVSSLQAQYPNWVPNDGDLAVNLIEGLAPMASNAAQIAAQMPPAALIAYGTQILGIPYEAGVQAWADATLTVQDANGPYYVQAGAEFDLGGVAFQTTSDLTIPNGQTTGTVMVQANDPGVAGNNLTAASWVPINVPVYVTGLSLAADTTGGVDPQDDQDYLNMVAQEMQLRSKSIITLPDFEIVAVNTAGIGRCVAVAENGSPRNIDVFVIDPNGALVAASVKTNLSDIYATTRMTNAVVSILDPVFTPIDVTYSVLADPGVDAVGLEATINARLAAEFSAAPGGWGTPSAGQVGGLTWVDQPIVHLNRVIGVISGVTGVNYVETCLINGNAADFTMNSGAAGALPQPGTFTGTIDVPAS